MVSAVSGPLSRRVGYIGSPQALRARENGARRFFFTKALRSLCGGIYIALRTLRERRARRGGRRGAINLWRCTYVMRRRLRAPRVRILLLAAPRGPCLFCASAKLTVTGFIATDKSLINVARSCTCGAESAVQERARERLKYDSRVGAVSARYVFHVL